MVRRLFEFSHNSSRWRSLHVYLIFFTLLLFTGVHSGNDTFRYWEALHEEDFALDTLWNSARFNWRTWRPFHEKPLQGWHCENLNWELLICQRAQWLWSSRVMSQIEICFFFDSKVELNLCLTYVSEGVYVGITAIWGFRLGQWSEGLSVAKTENGFQHSTVESTVVIKVDHM